MLLSKNLEGATVERIYWAVPAPAWLPVVGTQFDSLQDAQEYADQYMAEHSAREALMIVSRIVFRRVDGASEDVELDREMRYR